MSADEYAIGDYEAAVQEELLGQARQAVDAAWRARMDVRFYEQAIAEGLSILWLKGTRRETGRTVDAKVYSGRERDAARARLAERLADEAHLIAVSGLDDSEAADVARRWLEGPTPDERDQGFIAFVERQLAAADADVRAARTPEARARAGTRFAWFGLCRRVARDTLEEVRARCADEPEPATDEPEPASPADEPDVVTAPAG